MVSTSKLSLYQPIGTLLADHNLTGSTTTQFHCTNAQAAAINIGMRVRIYAKPFSTNDRTLIGTVTITNKETNVPSAGVTRLTFTPACTQPPDFADQMFDPEVVNVTTALSNQMQTIDDRMDAILCTPGTRPGSPFTGQITVESAVFGAPPFEVRRWSGSTWELIVAASGGSSDVGGRVAYVTSNTASSNSSSGTEVGPYLSATFTAQAGHTYLLEFSAPFTTDTASFAGAIGKFRVASGGSVSTGSTYIDSEYFLQDFFNTLPLTITFTATWLASTTEQVTVGVFHEAFSGITNARFTANGHSYLAIEDGGVI